MNDETIASRSTTMSPGPQSDPIGDVETGHDSGEVMMTSRSDAEEDGPKQTDTDEDMRSASAEPTRVDGARDTDAESSGTRSAMRSAAVVDGPARRRQRADLASPTALEWDEMDMWDLMANAPRWVEDSGLVGMGYECSQMRVISTSPSSYLRPGSRFTGTQQSERQRYDVQVEIKHVDLRESFLCGYLKIQGAFSPLLPLKLPCSSLTLSYRPDGRPPNLNHIFRGRDNRP